MKHKQALISIALLLACGALFYLISIPTGKISIAAAKGTADLRGALSDGKIASVASGWESYPGSLYTPEDFRQGNTPAPLEWKNEHGDGKSVGTHRVTLLLPAGEETAISFRSIDYATKIYIDGELVGEVGKVGMSEQTTTPLVSYCYFVVAPEDGETEVILQYANFHHRRGGWPPELTIGAPEALQHLTQRETFSQVMNAGLLFAAFLYHTAMFALYGGRRTYLYFALLCLLFALRAITPFIIVFLGQYDWHVMFRLEYALTFVALMLVVLFFRSLFPAFMSKPILWTTAAVMAVYVIVVIATPPEFFSRVLIVMQTIFVLALGYIALKLGLALKKGGLTVFLALIGFAVLLATVMNDVLLLNNLPSTGVILMPAGIAAFTFAYMLILSLQLAENERRLEAEAERLAMEMEMTERTLAAENAALEHLNKMRTEFLHDMSHEMKNPLTVIATGIDYADRQIKKAIGDMPEGTPLFDASRAMESAREETQRLGRMVGSMVELASMSEGSENRKHVNFADLIVNGAETYRQVLQQRGNSLTVEIAPDLPAVFIEIDKFAQVIANLLSNAANHTQDGRITLTADADGEFITVRVTDTGEGIKPELLQRDSNGVAMAFKHGVSGRGGTGYGLAICKTIVEAHGGTISIESEESDKLPQGKGTTVTFTVPVYGGQEAGHNQ